MTDKPSKYKLAIAMPVLNEGKFIGRTLEQVYMQDFPMDQVEIILADGGSTDSTREIAQSFKNRFGSLQVLDSPKRRPSSGRNLGIKHTTAPYILVLDGHSHIPDKHLLSSVVELFEQTGASCLCRAQPLTPPDINEFEKSVALCRASVLGHKPGSEIFTDYMGEVDPTSSGAMYRRSVVEQIGYFDEDFDACEDVDFNYRVHQSGLKSFISPRLKVFYYPRSSLNGLWRQMVRYGIGRFRFARKHSLFSPIQWLAAAGVLGFGLLLVLSFLSTPMYEVFKTLTAFYLLVVILFSVFLALKEKHFGCLIYGPLIFPTVHFGLGFGFLKGALERYIRK